MLGFTRPNAPHQNLAGRDTPVLSDGVTHVVFGGEVLATPPGSEVAYLGLGCFWGAEKLYWETPGVTNTAVGYAGGATRNPSYQEVCSGRTGHAEVVRVCFAPARISYSQILNIFFENHDPTQGMRQGNAVGTQYRSAIYPVNHEQEATAISVRDRFAAAFSDAGFGPITTEITRGASFYPAERYHQQYLAKNPHGYCPIHATGVRCDPTD